MHNYSPKSNTKFLLLFFLLSFITQTNSETSKPLELDKKITGKLDKDDSREYYTLTIPKDKEINSGSLLIFTVKESRKGIKEGDEIFSDPDIYVSKSNKFPANREDADWFSERYGSDILTIPSNAVDKGETFFVCMYCQYKCRYELKAYLTKEVPLNFGKFYNFNMQKGSSLSYSLYVPQNEKKEDINIMAQNSNLQNFKIFVSKESPSSQNTFQIIPSTGGYMIIITKNLKEYCNDCTYHILLQAQDDMEIQINAYFQSTITEIKSGDPFTDAVKNLNQKCYFFNTMNKEKIQNDKLILQVTLFSGSVLMKIYGWDKSKVSDEINVDSKKIEKYTYNINSDKTVLLSKEDYLDFDNNFSGVKNEDEEKNLYFCIKGQQMSSYFINIYFLSEAGNLQKYNFLSPGAEITGYLKGGQVTRYRVLDFNLNKNSDITLTFSSLNGKIEFYSTYCTKRCKFDNDLLQERISLGEMKKAENTFIDTYKIFLKKDENKCYIERKNTDILKQKCKTLAVIKCDGNPEDICIFKILPSFTDQPIFLFPKRTYYNIILKGKTDLYEVNINDSDLNSVVIVLTTVTGDAELSVFKKSTENEPVKEYLLAYSKNKDYIPDVVRITPAKLKTKDVNGQYIIKVTSETFSSYNLYYYTTRIKKRDEQPNIKDITTALVEGKIISDYFPNDLAYKIYSYTPLDKSEKNKKDIKIILTRINVNFSFKVYLDFNKIKYNYDTKSKYEERLKNYLWASDLNNEVTISKKDKNYNPKGPYYIVVTKDDISDENNELDTNSLMVYYLGVSKLGTPFSLNEGIEHSETLSETYNFQNYWYFHRDFDEPFQLDVNVLSGEVDIFIDVIELSKENITKIYENKNSNNGTILRNSTMTMFDVDDFNSIQLDKNYFEENKLLLNNKNNKNDEQNNNFLNKSCSIYIYITQSKYAQKFHKDSQYIITAKSSLTKGNMLISGEVYYVQLSSNRPEHYIIQEVKHRKGAAIHLVLKKGDADLYVNIPENVENSQYPDEKKFDYKGEPFYKGKMVKIPAKVFDRLNSKSLKLKILISVVPKFDNENINNDIEYSISYSSEPKRISQNIPYQSFISEGEYQYFTFYFGKSTENIYISLSNMNGDADMYLNYGNEVLPTPEKYNWASNSISHEYIDINKDDKFYKENKKDNISGYYTLLIVGFTETTYTLFISSHNDNILTLVNNSPVSCRCQLKNDKCYFRFNDVFLDSDNNNNTLTKEQLANRKNEIIFTTQYIYGNGKMYAKVLKDQEITNDNYKKYQEFFPTKNNFDFSNSISGKRNYLKVTAQGNKYSKDSLILLTFECEERTDVEITAASATTGYLFTYLDADRENIFFLKTNTSLLAKKQLDSIFTFYSRKEEDLIYELHAYTGNARVRVYTNESKWNDDTKEYTYDYNHIAEFNIKAGDTNEEFSYFKTYTENYFNSISKYLIHKKNVYFSIKPFNDFGFYIQVLYDRSWVNLPIGTTKSFLINKKLMYGYFDIAQDFSNVELSLSLEERNIKSVTVYAKILVINKNAKDILSTDAKNYHQEIPSSSNNDYKGKTDDLLGTLNLNLENLPIIRDSEIGNKFVRVLLTFKVSKKKTENNENNENNNIINYTPETTVHITITPAVNNFKRVDLAQHTYYLSNTSLLNDNLFGREYDGNKEVKIYSLDKKNLDEQKMFIDISVCNGDFEFKIGNKITNYDDNRNNIIIKLRKDYPGTYRYLVDNLYKNNKDNKHLYLSIKPKQKNQDCLTNPNKEKCHKELSYLIYYYTMTNKEYNANTPDYHLKFENGKDKQLLIKIPQLHGTDFKNNFREQSDIEYTIFYTHEKKFCHYLESICHLSQVLNDVTLSNITFWETGNMTVLRNIILDEKQQYAIDNLNVEDNFCINVLARNMKTNELTAYFPIYNAKTVKSGWKNFFLFIFVISLLGFGLYLGFNYYQNIKSKEDQSGYPKVTEMGTIGSAKGGYTSISLDNY